MKAPKIGGVVVVGLLVLAFVPIMKASRDDKAVELKLVDCRDEFQKLQPNKKDVAELYQYVSACMEAQGFKRSGRDDVCNTFDFTTNDDFGTARVCWKKD